MYKVNMSIPQAIKVKAKICKLEGKLKYIEYDLFSKNKKTHGKFYYEFIPTIILAKQLQAKSLTLIKNEQLQYDADLILKDNSKRKVEWVTAIDHSKNGIRMEPSKAATTAPEYEEVSCGTVKPTPPHNKSHSTDEALEEIHSKLEPLIRNSFEKKLEKQKKGLYQNTILGIVIDDYTYNQQKLLDMGLKEAIAEIQNTNNEFIAIYLVGSNGFFSQIK